MTIASGKPSKRPKQNVEIFSCSGGMAEGFRRAGITFDIAIEFMPDHAASYEKNLGHRPVVMDARDYLRMLKLGYLPDGGVRLLVADPPCTPWSHAGLRKGLDDERDMLPDTCEIISILQPDVFLIGNVPGLDESKNLHVVQEHIGALAKYGYCVNDFKRLDAAEYGVPQHRVRPFWFGHKTGPCLQWPEPTHGDAKSINADQVGMPWDKRLLPYVTCWEALKHLSPEDLGRPVKVKRKGDGKGTDQITVRDDDHAMSDPNRPAHTLTKNTHSDGAVIVFNDKHRPNEANEPARTLRGGGEGHSAPQVVVQISDDMYSPHQADSPAKTILGSGGGGSPKTLILPRRSTIEVDVEGMPLVDEDQLPEVLVSDDMYSPHESNEPAKTIRAASRGNETMVIVDSPTHPASDGDLPANTVRSGGGGSNRAMKVPQSARTGHADKPGKTVTAKEARVDNGDDKVIAWPWDRPATAIMADERLSPPGHHDENFAIRSLPDAVIISEKAGAILQGFPETWTFAGKTKKARWSQIGQAMPPGLAEPVARAIVKQLQASGDLPLADVVPISSVGQGQGKAKRKRRG